MSATEGKVINCKAAVLWKEGDPFVIEEIQVEPPKAGEVRIKLLATGVCHTDCYNFGDFKNPGRFPVIRGHEGGGIIESVGPDVTDYKPGDHVIPIFIPQCYECNDCKKLDSNLCSKLNDTQAKGVMPDGTSRFKCRGQTIYHFMGTSTFTEYTVVAAVSVAKINTKAPLDKVCLLGCGISTGYGSAINAGKVKPGSICAVWGLGAVGLAVVMGCRKAGASKIYGIDINPAKYELGKKFGLTDFINPKDVQGPLQDYLVQLTNGGFDYTFECVGKVEVMRVALESARHGSGTSVVVGVDPSGREISTKPMELLLGRTWTGAAFGGWKSRQDVPKLVEQYLNKEIMVDEFVTHTMKLEGINEAFHLMLTGKSIHSVLYMN